MTQAVCYQCGAIKFGAYLPCEACAATPTAEDDLVISLAMTDHYFDRETLEKIGASLRERGTSPELDPENRRQLLELVRDSQKAVTQTRIEFGAEAERARKKRWWKFW